MTKIFKYKLEITDFQTLIMPEDATLLSVQFQNGELQLWAKVDDERNSDERTIFIAGTGNVIDIENGQHLEFLSTTQADNGLVWHVFELEG
jgi:hypothetical protein